jgi:serine/threonine protein kinase
VHDFSERQINLDFIGCHHDLRPCDILFSETAFILADFGPSTFKQAVQNSATPFKLVIDDYLAPECEDWDNGFQAGTVTRSSDVWSLGCIIAEIVTYIAFGHEGVKEFKQAREYRVHSWTPFQFHHGPKRLSDGVERWLEKLEQSSSLDSSLVVPIAPKALCLVPSDRSKAAELASRDTALCVVYCGTCYRRYV